MKTNILGTTIYAMLSEEGHALALFNKKLCPKMHANSFYTKEMFIVTKAIKKMASLPY